MAERDARDDPELLAAVARGELGALRALYERHAPWLTARLARRCNDRDVVDDVTQDAFVAVWKGAERWRGDGEVAAWLWGIAVRRLVSRLRGHRQAMTLPLESFPVARSAVQSVEDSVLLGVEYGDLGVALSRLSPDMRAVVQATVLDGLTTRETARLLGIPENTVRTRLRRAKGHLRPDTEPVALLVTGGGVLLAAAAFAAVLRRAGLESPSDLASPVVAVSVLGLGVFHPLSRWVSLVPTGAAPGSQPLVWTTVLLVSCGALLVATRDPYRWRLLH